MKKLFCYLVLVVSTLSVLWICLAGSFSASFEAHMDQVGVQRLNVYRKQNSISYDLRVDGKESTFAFPLPHGNFTKKWKDYDSLEDALNDISGDDKQVVLSVMDLGYIDMAINLYVSSFLKLNLSNYLFVCTEKTACDILKSLDINAFLYRDFQNGKSSSNYGTADFRMKTHIKTRVILEALELKYNVLISDVDIVFLKNPFLHLDCADCDIQIQSDSLEGNSGFYLARNTQASRELHAQALNMAAEKPSLSNQKTVDRTLERMEQENRLKVKMLPLDTFPNGLRYFEEDMRMFSSDAQCKDCVIMHNNWIVSSAGKIYRFKEHQMWYVDKNEYYSSPQTKYLTYTNPIDFGDAKTVLFERNALKSALYIAHVLNRTLIVPYFHCYNCDYKSCKLESKRCSLNTNLHIPSFDEYFSEKYREYMFLKNDLVPKSIRTNLSNLLLIESKTTRKLKYPNESATLFTPENFETGPTASEIVKWFSPYSSHNVLNFHSMYDVIQDFGADVIGDKFSQLLQQGVRRSDYRQYNILRWSDEVISHTAKTPPHMFATRGSIIAFILALICVICVLFCVPFIVYFCCFSDNKHYHRTSHYTRV